MQRIQCIARNTGKNTLGGLIEAYYKLFLKYRGKVAEWLKAADCKSVDYIYVGSNPTFPIQYNQKLFRVPLWCLLTFH